MLPLLRHLHHIKASGGAGRRSATKAAGNVLASAKIGDVVGMSDTIKKLAVMAALGVALSGCTAVKVSDTKPVAPPAPVAAPRPSLQPAQPGPWRITKTEWSKADEDGFGEFVRRIAESDCTTTISCMQSAANFYHDSDPPSFCFHADCAKWAYMLRAYYASKNGLPFSYVDQIAGKAAISDTPKHPISRWSVTTCR